MSHRGGNHSTNSGRSLGATSVSRIAVRRRKNNAALRMSSPRENRPPLVVKHIREAVEGGEGTSRGSAVKRLKGLEEHIEESFSGASLSEIDLDDMNLDDHDGCCGPSGANRGGTKVQKALVKIFDALKLTQFSEYVEKTHVLTLVCGVLLLISGTLAVNIKATSPPYLSKIANACLCSIYTILGIPALTDVLYKLAGFVININVLTIIAVFGTVVIGSPLEGGLLLVLFKTASLIEGRLTSAAKGNLDLLIQGAPKVAVAVDVSPGDMAPKYETETTLRVEEVQVGKYVIVKAGEIVPLDGRVVYGRSLITSENITGESLPYPKTIGDLIPAGARSVDGTIVIQTTRSSEESTPMRILRMTDAAQNKRSNLSIFLNNWLDLYSKVVLLSTLLISLLLPLFGVSIIGPNGSFYRSFAFLTAAAPCALVMAPLAYITAISAIARKGIIVKGGKVIDLLARCDTIALDKTGTLTEGELECTGIARVSDNASTPTYSIPSPSEDKESLSFALAVSQGSTHPISNAVKKCAVKASAANGFKVQDFRMIPGYGVEATAKREDDSEYEIQFGSIDFISKYISEPSSGKIQELVRGAGSDKVIAVLRARKSGNGDAGMTSLFTFSDKIRSKSAFAINDLQNSTSSSKLQVMMLTGDHEANALNVADKLGIDKVYAGLLPEDKVQYVEEMRSDVSKTGYIAMVGDGINDAPALATADVGIAFASSTEDAAASVADAIVLKEGGDHINSLPYVFKVAKKTRRIVNQNIMLAMISIIGASLPSVAGYIPLWMSVSLHEGSTVLVALNSLRCLLMPDDENDEGVLRKSLGVVGGLVGLVLCILAFKTSSILPKIGLSFASVALITKSAAAGLFAGGLHSLTGPDHLAALAPMSMGRSSLAAAFLGGLWGFGHSVGQIGMGLLFIFCKSKIGGLDLIEQFASAAIGATLILIGFIGIREAKDYEGGDEVIKQKKIPLIPCFGTGFLHGLSPDAILPILPALTLSRNGSLAFILCFVLGTIGAMATYTAFIGYGSAALSKRSPAVTRKISMGSSFIALALGALLLLGSIFGVDLVAAVLKH